MNIPKPTPGATLGISKEAIRAQAEAARKAREKRRLYFESHFLVTSLMDWIEIVERIPGLEAAHAELLSARLPTQDFARHVAGGQEATPALLAAAREIQAAFAPGENAILRFDSCMGDSIKFAVNEGKHHEVAPGPKTQDPLEGAMAFLRAAEILSEYPRSEMPVFKREWIQPRMLDGYPVEFRVWTPDGSVAAISNYYPQRPMTFAQWKTAPIGEMLRLTGEIAKAVPEAMCPDLLHTDARSRTFTTDWMLREDGALLWLEGGPGTHAGGAHPCCFEMELEYVHSQRTEPVETIRERWSMEPGDATEDRDAIHVDG